MPTREPALHARNTGHVASRRPDAAASGRLIQANKSLGNARLGASLQVMLAPDPRLVTDEQIYAGVNEMKQRDEEDLAEARTAEVNRLMKLTAQWSDDDRTFALNLLYQLVADRTHIDPRAISDRIRQPILHRYEAWLRTQDAERHKRCWKMDGLMGLLVDAQRGLSPEIDDCHSWFTDEDSHGPAELRSLERSLKLNRLNSTGTESPAEYVYWDVFMVRKRTDPTMLVAAVIASGIVNRVAAIAGAMPGTSPRPRTNTSPVVIEPTVPTRVAAEGLPGENTADIGAQEAQLPRPDLSEVAEPQRGPVRTAPEPAGSTAAEPAGQVEVFRVDGKKGEGLVARASVVGEQLLLEDVSLRASSPGSLLNIARQLLKFAAQKGVGTLRFKGFIVNPTLRLRYRTPKFDITVPATPEGLLTLRKLLTENVTRM